MVLYNITCQNSIFVKITKILCSCNYKKKVIKRPALNYNIGYILQKKIKEKTMMRMRQTIHYNKCNIIWMHKI